MKFFTMTATVVRNFLSSPATRRYPFVKRAPYPNTRGRIAIAVGTCVFCGVCQRRCPTGAIAVARPEKSWRIDRLRCTACGCCVEVCPVKCLAMENNYSEASTTGVSEDSFHA